jgi:hypothetical protein
MTAKQSVVLGRYETPVAGPPAIGRFIGGGPQRAVAERTVNLAR